MNLGSFRTLSCSVPEPSISEHPEVVPTDCPEDFLCPEDEVYELLWTISYYIISLKLGDIQDKWKIALSHSFQNHTSPIGSYHPICKPTTEALLTTTVATDN